MKIGHFTVCQTLEEKDLSANAIIKKLQILSNYIGHGDVSVNYISL